MQGEVGLNEDSQGPTAIHPPAAPPAPLRKGWNYGGKAMYDQEAGASKCQRLVIPITLPFQGPTLCLCPSFVLSTWSITPVPIYSMDHNIDPFSHSLILVHPPEDLGGQGLLYNPHPPHHSARFFLDLTVCLAH